jgi:ABC-type sugar transport system permease subunit
MTSATPSMIRRIEQLRREARRTSGWAGLLYVLPALTILIVFEFWPIFYNLYISFWRWDVGPIRFIGLENYRRLFLEGFITTDYLGRPAVGEVLQSLIVTTSYAVIRVVITLGLAFILAYLLFIGVRRGRTALRTAYFLPYITSSVAVMLVFGWIFNERVGLANALLQTVGLPPQTWLQDPFPALKRVLMTVGVTGVTDWPDLAMGPSTAMVVVIIYSIWASLGYNIVIYLAGLASVPNEVIEAARIDGADGWHLLRYVIWPLVSPITFFLLITNTISALQAFDPIYTLTRNTGMGRGEAGGPLDTTLTITVYIFRNFYERANSVGYAAAVAFLLFFIILGLTIWQFRTFGRSVHYQ